MNILDIVPMMNEKKGEVGIEIEVEGTDLPPSPVGWRREDDGSLRGESGEYVLKQPVSRKSYKVFLDRVATLYEEYGTEVADSPRTSVHIHINVQDLSITQVYNYITLFLMFEHSLVKWCGEHRQGNLFCLRSKDANGLISILEEASTPDNINLLNTDQIRYSAINASSLFKYGSLEFRSMRGTDDFNLIKKWVSILLSLKDYAKKVADPMELISSFSVLSPRGMIQDVFKGDVDVILEDDEWEKEAYTRMRSLQMMAYNGDWAGFNGKYVRPEPKPFFPQLKRRNMQREVHYQDPEDGEEDIDGSVWNDEVGEWQERAEYEEYYGFEEGEEENAVQRAVRELIREREENDNE